MRWSGSVFPNGARCPLRGTSGDPGQLPRVLFGGVDASDGGLGDVLVPVTDQLDQEGQGLRITETSAIEALIWQEKFGNVLSNTRNFIRGAPKEEIPGWPRQILTAESIEDAFADDQPGFPISLVARWDKCLWIEGGRPRLPETGRWTC